MFSDFRSTSIMAGTIMHRNTFLQNVPFDRIASQGLLLLDHPTNVFMAKQGNVAYIDRVALFWRRHEGTISTPKGKEKSFRYIDHEVKQGLFFANEFPHTVYDFTKEDAEEFRVWQMYNWALSAKDYATLKDCLHQDNFPKKSLKSRPERLYIRNRGGFYLYVYGIKKILTAIRLLKNKIKR